MNRRDRDLGKVLVAMSGGVDSSVAAALLAGADYDVVGVTMQIWQESQTDPRHAGCCSLGAVEDARRVARILGIPHYVVNFRETFRQRVIDDFIADYERGRTPNPCVQCNRLVKFDALLKKMHELGCERLATGHYARVALCPDTGRPILRRALDRRKDQSYALATLSAEQLSHVLLPLGEVESKSRIRKIARDLGLPVADKPDSQDICFVSEAGGYHEFLRRQRPDLFRRGEIVDTSGRVLGHHEGVADFTVGQRRGLRLAKTPGHPLYVVRLEPSANRVVVGRREESFSCEVPLEDLVWGAARPDRAPLRVQAKIRSSMEPRDATLFLEPYPRLEFDEPVHAVTPGQIAVAYVGDAVALGATISSGCSDSSLLSSSSSSPSAS